MECCSAIKKLNTDTYDNLGESLNNYVEVE